eukprot:g14925.t1
MSLKLYYGVMHQGWVNYNDFMADLVLFQKNMQESSMWFVFSCFDANGRGEADRRQIHRDLGNGKALLHQTLGTFGAASLRSGLLPQVEVAGEVIGVSLVGGQLELKLQAGGTPDEGLLKCVATNFPGVSIDTVRQTIGQASGRVKFEEPGWELFDALHSAAYEGKTSKDKPFSQRF